MAIDTLFCSAAAEEDRPRDECSLDSGATSLACIGAREADTAS